MGGAGRLPRAGRRWLLAAAAVLLAAAGSGCGGRQQPGRPASPPAGFATYHGPAYTVAYPAAWRPSHRPNPGGGPATLLVTGPAGAGGFTPQLAVGHDTGYASGFDDALAAFRTVAVGRTGQVVSDRPVRLAGAARAQRTEYTERRRGADGRDWTIRLVELHAITPARTMFDVLVRAPDQDFANAKLDQTLDSFRITSP
jgi:hypothetical protein